MPIAPITDWGEAIRTALAGALALFLTGIPRIIGFLIILLIGWSYPSGSGPRLYDYRPEE
jgi:hypothetical protein